MPRWTRLNTLCLTAGLVASWLLAVSNAAGDSPTTPLFTDVTGTHLPSADLRGLSMDARFADVDRDGDLDLVIANEFRPNLLLLNDGRGQFSNVSDMHLPRTRRDSEDVGIADFDRDGDLDIIIVSEDDRVNEFYLNDGQGRFTDASERIPVTGVSNAVLVTDIDDDEDADILIGNNGQNVVLINDGNGFFTDETAQRLPQLTDVTQDIELGDVDGDGDRDLLIGNEGANRLLLDTGGGFFREAPPERLPLTAEPEETREADFGDADGDGDLDILFANVRLFVSGTWRQNRLLINNGQGDFSDETAQRLPAADDQSMDGDFVDIDADGDLDIITANLDSVAGLPANARYWVYTNDGQGIFVEETDRFFPPDVTGNGLDIEAADVNGDQRLD